MEQIIDKINFDRKAIKWLYDLQKDELLSIDNSFQRRYVWVHKNQVQLVESILNGFPIPEIYVWEGETNPISGETIYSIVDGQQRLGAIFDFLNDKYKLAASFIDLKESDYKNKLFSELTDDQKSKFWKYPLAVRFVKDSITKDDIIAMFLRLNKTNTTLNPQELRNAEFEGLFLKLSQEIADNKFWSKNGIFNPYDYRRMLDIEFASSILVFFRFGFNEDITQASINRAYDTFNDQYKDYNRDKKLFECLIESAKDLVKEYPGSLKFIRKKIHLYTLFTTLYFYHIKYKEFKGKHLTNYGVFATDYDKKDELLKYFGPDKEKIIDEYKRLALEGTGRRANRQRRFEIMRELTE